MRNYLQTFTRCTGDRRNKGKSLTRLLALLLMCMMTGVGLAQTESSVTFTCGKNCDISGNNGEEKEITKTPITVKVKFAENTGTKSYIKANSSTPFTFSSNTGYSISGIVFNANSSSSNFTTSSKLTAGNSITIGNRTVKCENTVDGWKVSFEGGNLYIKEITVYYTTSGSGEGNKPSINNIETDIQTATVLQDFKLKATVSGTFDEIEWFKNTTNSTEGGESIGTGYELTRQEETAGTYYYYCKVKYNNKTEFVTSEGTTAVNITTATPSFDATRFTIQVGKTYKPVITATVNGHNVADGNTFTFTYTSDDETIATVAADGTVTGVAPGTTNVRFKSAPVEGKYKEAEGLVIVTVSNAADYIPGIRFRMERSENDDESIKLPETEDDAYEGNGLRIYLEPNLKDGETMSGTYEIYYTLDGTPPTGSNGKKLSNEFISITSTTFLKAAIKMTSGTNKNKWGETTERTFRFNFTLLKKLENNQLLEPGRGYDITENGRTYIITTYGSKDDTGLWEKGVRDAEMNNSYISGFEYHAIGKRDALSEPVYNSAGTKDNPMYDGTLETHNTFDLPIKGSYIKFEPKMDGEVNVIVRQNGIIGKDAPTEEDYKVVRKRYAYACDETGFTISKADGYKALISTNSIVSKGIFNFSESKLAGTAEEIANYTAALNTYKEALFNKAANKPEGDAGATPTAFWDYCRNNYTKNIKNVLIHDETTNGYYVVDKAYVRYSFPVKAGKTYFFFGRWTKLAPCGYSFKRARKDAEWDNFMDGRTVTVEGEKATTALEDKANDGAYEITLNRNFKANAWTSLVLPFSVSPTEVINSLGEGTEIVHFNKVVGDKLFVTKHFHQMIVAGTPVLVKPAKDVSSITFTGTYEKDNAVNDMKDNASGWTMTGSYTTATVPAGAYMMGYNAQGESSMRYISNDMTVNGTRAWLVNKSNSSAKITSLYINGVEDNGTTAIDNIFNETTTVKDNVKGIYNLNGQMVRANGDTTGLPAGIYIVNGKKTVVNK